MLMQRLREYAERQNDLGPPLYSLTTVRYEVPLDNLGNPISNEFLPLTGRGDSANDRGLPVVAPYVVDRTSGIKPCLLVDTAEYALGAIRKGRSANRVERQHQAFIDLLDECADETGSQEVATVARYLKRGQEQRIPVPSDLDTSLKVRFSVANVYPEDLPEVREFWRWRAIWKTQEESDSAECMVCGQIREVVPTLPLKIRRIPRVNPTDGDVKLYSTNERAFESYRLHDLSCAPICVECADATCKALNHLLDREVTHVLATPLIYAIWANDSESPATSFLSDPNPTEVQALFAAAETGSSGALGVDGERFNCVGLGRSAGRAVVRDWIDISVDRAQSNLARYFRLMSIVEPWGSDDQDYFGVWRLSRSTLRSKSKRTDRPDPDVPRVLIRCALQGGRLPDWLLAQAVKRIRAEQEIDHVRAALVKMVLASQETDWMTTMVGLDEQNRNPGYLCGRLLAVLDQIQRTALDQRNATIVDRYFGTASTAPISVFPRLVSGAQPHLKKLRRDRPGAGRALEDRMQEIIYLLDGFPSTLKLPDQGFFVLGYYHQRAADRRAASDRREQQTSESTDKE